MPQEAASVLLGCLSRAVQDGLPLEGERIEHAIVDHVEGRRLTTTLRMRLVRFLDEVRWHPDDYFTHEEKFHADRFLRSLAEGHIPPRSSVALALPPGRHPEMDVLIHQPRQSLEDIYFYTLQKKIGTPQQHQAIEKMLWLRPLDHDDYKQAHAFLDALSPHGSPTRRTQLAQARFLLEMLAPGTDPHGLVEKLRAADLPKQLRRATGGPHPVLQNPAASSLDDLLVTLSGRLRDAAEEGDVFLVQKLRAALENVSRAVTAVRKTPARLPVPAVFTALKGRGVSETTWDSFDRLASHPLMNVALMPLGVAEHILASVIMGEMSWEESIDEALDVFGGAVMLGGSIWGTAAAWGSFQKIIADKKLGVLFKKISERAPPKVRAYLVPALFLTAFTYVALRQSQNLPLEEAGEYRWNFLEEMAGAFGVQLAVTGGAFWGIRRIFNRLGRAPKGKIGGGGVLALATGAGMLAQEIYSGWRRRKMRTELKAKTYRELLNLLKAHESYPDHLKPKLQARIDRKFSILLALNILDFPSVREAIRVAEGRAEEFARLRNLGFSEELAIRMMDGYGKMKPLNKDESETAQNWIQKMNRKESTGVLPVSLLPAQKRRVLSLWEKDLSDVIQFAVYPVPLPNRPKEEEMEDWNISHTMSLFRRYLERRSL
ncbi:MAG: hypothetical protein HY466_00380 [Deltaproteobacteria bacterium]|nr:hypothetical protein [Deltaproteobacteria bacterium]